MRLNPFSALSTQHSILIMDALREAVLTLQQAKIDTASLDARILLEYALSVSREKLLLMMDEPMEARAQAHYRALIECRSRRQPIAQLIGQREFWGMTFKVTCDTLDPRPDSETLVEAVLSRSAHRASPLTILDLGTGTGCLLLALLQELPDARGVGVDVSPLALAVARENALLNGLSARVEFIESSWDEKVKEKFDIVISNPPYIPLGDAAQLAPEVMRFEPHLALFGGEDGLDAYRHIIATLPALLAPDGFAALEIGYGQQGAVEALARQHGLCAADSKKDMQGIVRCVLMTHSL